MEWHITEALTLSAVDYAIGEHLFSPAEYEIIRQVIVATADGEFKELIKFSEQSLQAGAAALAARLPIVADSAPVSASITAIARDTFANLVLCRGSSSTVINQQIPSSTGAGVLSTALS